ncbi:unnamed protein product [Symbiodinium sp. CCMP2592]|nr:unnamed protein product [Symbiodinium sp. CCMP2592]
MPPKMNPSSQAAKPQGGKQKGKGEQTSQQSRIEFGLPQTVVQAVQSISTRATQDLWSTASMPFLEGTAEQNLQKRTNMTNKLAKRLAGNSRAKSDMALALQTWFVQIGQHAAGLLAQVRAIGQRLDADTEVAANEMREILAEQPSESTSQQVERTFVRDDGQAVPTAVGLSSGHLFGAGLMDQGSEASFGGPHGGQEGFATRGNIGVPAGFAGLLTPEPTGPTLIAGDGGCMGPRPPVTVSADAGLSSGGRWRKRSGVIHERPSKSPRRDVITSPWHKEATGLTPETVPRPAQTLIAEGEVELSSPATRPAAMSWTQAWLYMLRFAVDNGDAVIGEVATSDTQDLAMPLQKDGLEPAVVVAAAEKVWQDLVQLLREPSTTSDMTASLYHSLAQILHHIRSSPGALGQVRQGLVVAAQLSAGNLLDPFSFAPATAQEWLFPNMLIERGEPLKGFIAAAMAEEHHLRALLMLPCLFTSQELIPCAPEGSLGPAERRIAKSGGTPCCELRAHSRPPLISPKMQRQWKVLGLMWLLCSPVQAAQVWPVRRFGEHTVYATGSVPDTRAVSDLAPASVAGTPCMVPALQQAPTALRDIAVFAPQADTCPVVLQVDERVHGALLFRWIGVALGFRTDYWLFRRQIELLPSLPPEQYVVSAWSQAWHQISIPVTAQAQGCMLPQLSLEDVFSASLSLPSTDESAFHHASGHNAVIITPFQLQYVHTPHFAAAEDIRISALQGVLGSVSDGVPFLRILPPLAHLPAVQFVTLPSRAARQPTVLDLRPVGGGIHVVACDSGDSPEVRLRTGVDAFGAPLVGEVILREQDQGRLLFLHQERQVAPDMPLHVEGAVALVVLPLSPVSAESEGSVRSAGRFAQVPHVLVFGGAFHLWTGTQGCLSLAFLGCSHQTLAMALSSLEKAQLGISGTTSCMWEVFVDDSCQSLSSRLFAVVVSSLSLLLETQRWSRF